MKAASIELGFTSFWLSGTGAAAGQDVDAACYRDSDGCPAVPMTQIKGVLRESAERLANAEAGGWTANLVVAMFGADGDQQGALAWKGDARLSEAERCYFNSDAAARAQLFRVLRATSINAFGVAENRTLRAVEAAVPMSLTGVVHAGPTAPTNWLDLLDHACAATLAFGKLRTDGYGRVLARATPAIGAAS